MITNEREEKLYQLRRDVERVRYAPRTTVTADPAPVVQSFFVDDQINARRRFKRTDIAPFPSDDSTFHGIVGNGNHRDRGFRDIVTNNALNRAGDDFPRLTLGVLTSLFDRALGKTYGIEPRLRFHFLDQLFLSFIGYIF